MQQWIEASEKFSHVTDKIGKPIDKGIFDAVVALNILGFDTYQSCEGHMDHGLPFPWIDITLPHLIIHDTPEGQELRKQLKKTYTPEMMQLFAEEQRLQSEKRYGLFRYLSAFYEGRVVRYDRIIAFDARSRLRSQGGEYLSLLPEDERVVKSHEYQDEMREFTAFLKSICLS